MCVCVWLAVELNWPNTILLWFVTMRQYPHILRSPLHPQELRAQPSWQQIRPEQISIEGYSPMGSERGVWLEALAISPIANPDMNRDGEKCHA